MDGLAHHDDKRGATVRMAKQHGGNVWLAQKIYGLRQEQILDFSANINPLGPSPLALTAIQQALNKIKHYPEPQAASLRRVIADLMELPEELLILGNGAAELIYALARVIKPRRLLLPVPTFSEYAEGFGDVAKMYLPLNRANNFALSADKIAPLLQAGDLLIICNPNNPTGQLVEQQQLSALIKRAGQVGAGLLIDEAFMDFVRPEQSLLQEVQSYPFLFVLRSLTKFFAIPGLRLGYLVAPQQVVEQLYNVLPPWRVNLLAQVAGLASLQDKAYMDETLELIGDQKAMLYSGLAAIKGLEPLPPTANFILVDCRASGITAREFQNHLGPRGILIRLCDNFPGLDDYYFRVAIRNAKENLLLIKNLQEYINQV